MKKHITLACLLLACLLVLTACGGGLKDTMRTAYNAAKPTGLKQVRHLHYQGPDMIAGAAVTFGISEDSMPSEGHIFCFAGHDNILVLMGMNGSVISVVNETQLFERSKYDEMLTLSGRPLIASGFMIRTINPNDPPTDDDVINSWRTMTQDAVNSLY